MKSFLSSWSIKPVTLGRVFKICLLFLLLLFAVSIVSLFAGAADITLINVIRDLLPLGADGHKALTPAEKSILLSIRLPRVILAGLVGAALSMSGVVFQALLRNPLTDPYILGISAGSAVGAVTGILLGAEVLILGISGMAFLGAILSVCVVFGIAGTGRRLETTTLLLTGVMVNAFFSAVILFVFSISDHLQLQRAIYWTMGDLSLADGQGVLYAGFFLFIGMAFIYRYARSLNILATGEETALQLGISVGKTKIILLTAASLVTATAVAASGTIGFVGLIIPHIMRLIVGPDHRLLLPASLIFGGAFLVLADTMARCLVSPAELPVGVITALCGAPYFLVLLRRRVSP
ncbi:MAG: Iron transporter [Thermodesulfobacteriota bacterium]|nr:Iron transporter [Thermodesulfobacteriota bacterium]